jgi:hypothetical protein
MPTHTKTKRGAARIRGYSLSNEPMFPLFAFFVVIAQLVPTRLLTGPRGWAVANTAASGPSDRAAGREEREQESSRHTK